MAVTSKQIYINTAGYTVQIESAEVDANAGEIRVTVGSGERTNNFAIVQDAVWELYQGGAKIGEIQGFSARSGFVSTIGTITAPIDVNGTSQFSVDLTFPAWDERESFSFVVPIPDPDPVRSDFSVSCGLAQSEYTVGEVATVTLSVDNSGDVGANFTGSVTVAGATNDNTVRVPPGGSESVGFEFELLDVGEYQPSVEWDVS